MASDSITPAASGAATAPVPTRHIYNNTEPVLPVAGARPVAASGKPATMDELRDAVKKIQDNIGPGAQDLRFSIDEDTGTPVIKLIDTKTDTVLRQIPTVEALEISKALDKLQGLLVRETA